MTQLSTQTAENHRFQQLLDPIRDLTENWNIDLASQLEEYLEEIEQVEITFDNGKSRIDFVQAALLIQGSTHVFSRKVEYLYTLVIQTLDLLSSQKKLEQVTNSPHPTSRAHSQTTFDLLTLDDVPTRDSELKESILVKDTKLIPETPTALLANTTCLPATPLYNTSREVVGHRQDFHLLTAIPHHSGTLLLEPSLASFLNTEPYNTTALSPLHDAYMHEDDGGSGYDSPGCPDSPSTPHRSAAPSSVVNLPHTASIAQLLQSGDVNNEKNLSVGSLANPLMNLLNPYDTMPGSEKPFKKGKTYRIPPSLQATAVPAKRKREPQTDTIGLIEHLTHNLWSGKNQFPKNSLLQLSFLPLEQKYWEEVKRRGEALKKLQRNAALQRSRADSSMPISKFYSHLDAPAQELDSEGEEVMGFQEDAGVDSDPEPEPAEDLPNFEMVQNELTHITEEPTAPAPSMAGYARKVRKYLDDVRHKAQSHAQNTALSTRVEEWRRYVTPILERQAEETAFNINQTCVSLVSRIKSHATQNNIEWSQFTQGMRPNEIACHFLTSLVLANNYNIQLHTETGTRDNDVRISLLNDRLAFEEVAAFIAPSLDQ